MTLRLAFLSATLVLGFAGTAWSAAAVDNVCLATYAYAIHVKTHDIVGVAAAAVMPRVTAEKLVSDYSRIFDYPDQVTMLKACQCMANPAPANSTAERDQSMLACPKPTRIE